MPGPEGEQGMILIGLGANLPSPAGGPVETLKAALHAISGGGARVADLSRFYRSAPVPPSGQPDYVNAVARVETGLDAAELLGLLHRVEAGFGRVRRLRNDARPLDLDLIAYGNEIRTGSPELPHPRMADRAFVLLPLADIAPDWRHPVTGTPLADLIARLPEGQDISPLPG